MFQLDDNFLASIGLDAMPADDKVSFLEFIYDELKRRVGAELSKNLSTDHLDHFEKLFASGDQNAVLQWMKQHCPNYKEVVSREIDKIKAEIIPAKDRLLDIASDQARA